jgi:branched-chain amino acid aminotransferase
MPMYPEIKITKTTNSKLSSLDFNHIPFGKIFSDHMFSMDYANGVWSNPEIIPFGDINTHPGNLAWHYGQSIFEGMKASLGKKGNPILFRPEKHVDRINESARRMCMPEIPGHLFLAGVRALLKCEIDWIPPAEGSALYLRPIYFATDESIGVRPSDTYKFLILALPVGPYYSAPVRLKADSHYVRAVVGGVGEAKTAGNYAASLYPAKKAVDEGFDQVMWLDAIHHKFVQEVGTMNIFFVIGNEVVTPATDGAILKGITRDCIMTVLRDKGYNVVERPITIDEVVLAHKNGDLKEVFGTGTAAVVSPVSHVGYKEVRMDLDVDNYKIAPMIKDLINKIRVQEAEDKFGWLVELD